MDHWGKRKDGRSYKKRNNKKITGVKTREGLPIDSKDQFTTKQWKNLERKKRIPKGEFKSRYDVTFATPLTNSPLTTKTVTRIQGKDIPVSENVKKVWERNTTQEQREDPTFNPQFSQKILKQFDESLKSTSKVRKNARFGSSTWYLKPWKEGDRTAPQFGLLLSTHRDWITKKEANHVRISKQEAMDKLSGKI